MTPPKNEDTHSMLGMLLEEMRGVGVQVARMEERLEQVAAVSGRLETAIFGNGKPGLKAELDDFRHRLEELEEARRKDEAGKEAEWAEWRKFRWGVAATGATVLVDLGLRLIGWMK